MTGRRSVWSDARVIQLSKQFTPAADEVWRLQRGSDPECRFFQQMAEHGHYGGNAGSTRQGIYVCAPSGKFLASINSTNPDRVIEMMQEGLAAWQRLPQSSRNLAADSAIQPEHRWEDSYPVDGLVLNIVSRDLPPQCDPTTACEVKWNQDYAWFSKAEARRWLGADPRVGDEHRLPENLTSRLARLHFVDAVKGQTSRFSASGVDGSAIVTRIVARDGASVQLDIHGQTIGSTAAGWWRESSNGVVTQLLGKARYDLTNDEFTEFELVALGRRWGATSLNGRRRDPDTGPLGFVLRLSPKDAARVAPAFVASYDVDWIQWPTRR